MLNTSEYSTLITFVLKSRLPECAKFRMQQSYITIEVVLKDMRERLLPKRSDTVLKQQLQRARQDKKSIEEYGKEIEQIFAILTLSQVNADHAKYDVLKPINERTAIKRFSYRLRNSRLSTIISARNYSTLSEAISGVLDDEMSSHPEGAVVINLQHVAGRMFRSGLRNYHHQRGRSSV